MTGARRDDPDITAESNFFGSAQAGRRPLHVEELLRQLTAQFQTCEGCERVSVVGVTRLDPPDSAGCNWSSSIVLDPAGVQPEVYGRAYAAVIASARSTWNLK